MLLRACALVLGVLLAAASSAETIYKYRQADGKMIYSNRPLSGIELVETFEFTFPKPAVPDPKAERRAAEAEQRIKKHLSAFERAWSEVQDATRALAQAEERLSAGVEPQPGEREGVAASTAPPTVGGVPSTAPPAVGGSLSGRRGRAAPEYVARMQALEAAVQAARARLDAALSRYNLLR